MRSAMTCGRGRKVPDGRHVSKRRNRCAGAHHAADSADDYVLRGDPHPSSTSRRCSHGQRFCRDHSWHPGPSHDGFGVITRW